MRNPLKALGNFKQMQQQMKKVQEELSHEIITIDEDGVKIVMSADLKIKEISIDGEPNVRVKNAFEKAIKKWQSIAAKKAMGMTGGLGGLLGS